MGKRKRVKGNCIFCLERLATTREHVFPTSWYPLTTPPTVQRVVVPGCRICNEEFEKAESKVSPPLLLERNPDSPIVAGVADKLRRSWQADKAASPTEAEHRTSKLKSIVRQIEFEMRSPDELTPWRFGVPAYTPAGLPVIASPFLPIDPDAAQKICEKFVRGFHYHELRKPLPADTSILLHWFKDLPPDFQTDLNQLSANESLAPGLRYGVLREGNWSVWVFQLWGDVEFAATVCTPPLIPTEALTKDDAE